MLKGIWVYVVAGFSILLAGFFYVLKQKEKAEHIASKAKAKVHVYKADKLIERTKNKKQHAARQKAEEVREKHESRPKDKRPTGTFRRK